MFQLSDYIQKYQSLSTLRNKILQCLASSSSSSSNKQQGGNEATILRVETSISKSELDDIYAPFKPPAKGTLEERIKTECPELVAQIDGLWAHRNNNMNDGDDDDDDYDYQQLRKMLKDHRDKIVILLANRIAGDANVIDAIMDQRNYCRVQVKQSKVSGSSSSSSSKSRSGSKGKSASHKQSSSATITATNTYHDYSNKMINMQDYVVLAIKRGVDQKALKLTFELNDEYAKRAALQALHASSSSSSTNNNDAFVNKLYRDALDDAWARLLRKRCTSRLWKEKCQQAELRAIEVFCENLNKALLAPPAEGMIGVDSHKALLALDPGFKAGIKAAILSNEGKTLLLETVTYMGNTAEREEGKRQLLSLLERVQQICNGSSGDKNNICVVLGNGHGTREARQLLHDVTSQNSNVTVDIHLVSEAGASVWSVTEMASEEFPKETPASIAAVSIGRRYLNPLAELVKVPPRSLGLGMYQHDLSEKILDEKLTLTSIDCVAEVGVDVNSCSLAILQKVPSLTKTLAEKIFNSRPLTSRKDLLRVKGLGDKTYENAAAFIRVTGGSEPLDNTMVHPESYDLARWLLKELQWKLNDASSAQKVGDSSEAVWKVAAKKASKKFAVSEDRALSVVEHLFFSITSPDPRTRKKSGVASSTLGPSDIGSAAGCAALPPDIATVDKLRDSLPHRNVIGTVRNVVDFGAFVDLGLENDGLLHRSKLGPTINLGSLLVGEDIGVDILGVSNDGKISLGLAGLNFPVDDADTKKRSLSSIADGKRGNKPASKKKRHK